MRENDHLVEPLFGALQPAREKAPAPPRRRTVASRLLVGLKALIALIASAF